MSLTKPINDNKLPRRLSFLTFNAGLFQLKLFGFNVIRNPPFGDARLNNIPPALRSSEADIICLQEVFDVGDQMKIWQSLKSVYPYCANQNNAKFFGFSNGLVVLSRFKILYFEFYPFKNITFTEWMFGSKGTLYVEIEVPGLTTLGIFNVHMVSGTVNPESDHLNNLRYQETLEVLELTKMSLERGVIPVIMGDFNAGPAVCSSSYDSLLANNWIDAFSLGRYHALDKKKRFSSNPNHCFVNINSLNDTSAENQESIRYLDNQTQNIGRNADLDDNILSSFGEFDSVKYNSNDFTFENPKLFKSEKIKKITETKEKLIDLFKKFSSIDPTKDDGLGWTWDPVNPLNLIGPHSNCHGIRCDHIFVPKNFVDIYKNVSSRILFNKPRVLVNFTRKWFNPFKWYSKSIENTLIVTLSDHYAVNTIFDFC